MATIDWPTSDAFKPTDFVVGLSAPGTSWAPPYGGALQTASNLNDRLTARLSLAPLIDKSAAGQREAFLFGVKSAGDIVRAHHFARPYPNGTLRGSPTVNGAHLAGVRTIALSNCFGVNLLKNPSFEVDTDLNSRADYWSGHAEGSAGSVVWSLNSTNPTHGTYAQRINCTALASGTGNQVGVYQTVSMTAAQFSRMSLAADMRGTTGVTGVVYINFLNGGGTLVGAASASGVLSAGATSRIAREDIAVPAAAVQADVYIFMQDGTGASAVLDIDSAQLEASATASAFAPYATLVGGDMLGIGGDLLQVAYAGATANTDAMMSVPLSLATLAALSNGAAVTWSKPVGEWQIVGVDPQLTYQPGILQLGPEVTLIQV